MAVQGVCYGQSEVPVAIANEHAARTVIKQLKRVALPATPEIWTSPWRRTRDIAELVAQQLGATLLVDARLSELAFGEWEQRTYAELEEHDHVRFERWMQAFNHEAPPGGETVHELRARVQGWLSERTGPAPIVAFTHAGVVRTARALQHNLTYREVASQKVEHLRIEQLRDTCVAP